MGELVSACYQCKLYERGSPITPNIQPYGTKSPELYVVWGSPTQRDDEKAKMLQSWGRTWNEYIKTALDQDKVNTRHCFSTRCLTPRGGPTAIELTACSTLLHEDIEATKPGVILALGQEPLQALFPKLHPDARAITRARGSVLPLRVGAGFIPVVSTFSFGYVMKDEDKEGCLLEDIELAIKVLEWDGLPNYPIPEMESAGLLKDPPPIRVCKKQGDILELTAKLKTAGLVVFDLETTQLAPISTHGAPKAAVFSISFTFPDESTYVIPLYKYWSAKALLTIQKTIGKWLTMETSQVRVAHNVSFDLAWSLEYFAAPYTGKPGYECKAGGVWQDTQVMAWQANELPKACKLKVAASLLFGVDDWSIDVKDVTKLEPKDVWKYNGLDTVYTWRLYNYYWRVRKQYPQFVKVYNEVIMPAVLIFTRLKLRGIKVDETERLVQMSGLQKKQEELKEKIEFLLQGTEVAFNSPDQLSKYFVEECGYRLLKRTKKGWSVDVDTLEYLGAEYQDDVAVSVLAYRKLAKLNSTYVTGLQKNLAVVTGRAHGSYNLTGPVTGRTSSSDPNMQNFPKRQHAEIRRMFYADSGYDFVSNDYGQIEARLFGVTSNDPIFVQELWEGLDIHSDNAKILFGSDFTKDHRNAVKNATFALFYGSGNARAAAQVKLPEEAIADLRHVVFDKYTGISAWQQEVLTFAADYGYLESLFGRRRRMPIGYNEKLNFINQSSASDMTLYAMTFLAKKYEVAFFIHDDLTLQIAVDQVTPETLHEIAQVMLSVPWMAIQDNYWTRAYVPLQIETGVGSNWADIEEVHVANSQDYGLTTIKLAVECAKDLVGSVS